MHRSRYFALVILASLPFGSMARADKPADVLSAHQLKAGAAAYVLADESEVVEGMKSLRQEKKQVDADNRQRKIYTTKITAAKALEASTAKEYDGLKDRLTVVTEAGAHNRIVLRMNQLVIKSKQAAADQKDAENKENDISVVAETKFVDELASLGTKADEINDKYTALAADATVKAALEHAMPKLPLGPSKEFADALADLKKWRSETESEAIPLVEDGGIQKVTVLINGEQHKLVLDPGSSLVTMPAELAAQLKIVVTDQDPLVQMKIADGNVIQGRRTSLKTVRVGRFTIENVPCVVLAAGLHDAPALLGNSFLSHFVVKIDQKGGKLNLIEVAGETSPANSDKKTTGAGSSAEPKP